MKIVLLALMLCCMQFSAYAVRRTTLAGRLHPAHCTARVLAGTGTVLLHCGRPANQVGFVAVLAALALQNSRG